MSEFSWLLISDLHLKSNCETWSQSVVLRDMVRDIQSRTPNHPTIKFIVVSGDLAHGGKREEYNLVESFLDDLVSAVQLTRSDVFIVPGNHDIDRDIQELTFHGSRSEFTSANNVERFLSRPHERASLLSRLRAFNEFESRFSAGVEREFTQDRLAYISRRLVDGLPLGIVGLNSALACGNDDDNRNIVVGDRPIVDIVERIRESDIRLVVGVVHHPPVWLREFDQRTLERRFLPICDILHRGHLHEPDVQPIVTSAETNCLVVSAGASYVWRQFANSYSIVSLNVAEANCNVINYEYDSHSGAFSVAHSHTHAVRLSGDVPGDVADLTAAIRPLCEPTERLAP
ncbi:MAG TPA: metallophosphoesterase [Thermoguttaceae bacterium]|nr:metallophosphoesterase [Thermoguttaceae bacterium]